MNLRQKIYTISELNSQIKQILENTFPSIWISGEISNFKAHSSGHYYFSLKDGHAQISAVMFKGSNRFLKFQLEDGLEVIANGRVTVYEPRGSYQIVLEYLEPKGLGALQLAFEQLKKKLEAEGLFELTRKKALPLLPQKIGIITSPTGAAIRDLLQILQRRYPNIEVLLIPVQVQGEKAAPEIAAAMAEMNTFEDVDVLIVGRGGGSLEDLWAFNTELVARAIAASRIPIISAVGHEIDVTISDFVADLRAPTPSAAAELVVPRKEDLRSLVAQFQVDLYKNCLRFIKNYQEKLNFLKSHLRHPQKRLEELFQRLDELQERLNLAQKKSFEKYHLAVCNLQQMLQMLSPLAILKRGYAIVYQQQNQVWIPLKTKVHVQVGELLKIRLSEEELETKVTARGQL
ncbi:MAG: exodeoxyribonuclease VII large subunit [Deltaproteobacteria bacterium]|nr:exodeoxyribonuclease VII large subunit [Deltaproteobacteria bacterium]